MFRLSSAHGLALVGVYFVASTDWRILHGTKAVTSCLCVFNCKSQRACLAMPARNLILTGVRSDVSRLCGYVANAKGSSEANLQQGSCAEKNEEWMEHVEILNLEAKGPARGHKNDYRH